MNTEQTTNDTGVGGGPGNIGELTVIASVSFGNPQMAGGPCVGRGVCKQHATDAATKVVYSLSPDLKTLYMVFSLSELEAVQPEQAQYFASGSYQFDSVYKLDDKIYTELGVLAGAQIMPDSPTQITIQDDTVNYSVVYQCN